MDNIELIKTTLNMRDVIDKYGYALVRGDFILCPFHSEKNRFM